MPLGKGKQGKIDAEYKNHENKIMENVKFCQSCGMPLDTEDVKGKKYFLKRLKKSDPVLFKETNKKNGKIQRYTRMCQSMQQPVVLSDKEKTDIDEMLNTKKKRRDSLSFIFYKF